MTFYERFKELSEARFLTCEEAARAAGVSNPSHWKYTNCVPNTPCLLKIANYFHLSVETLLAPVSSPSIPPVISPKIRYSYFVSFALEGENGKTSHNNKICTFSAPLETTSQLRELENSLQKQFGCTCVHITNISCLSGAEEPNTNQL